MERQINSYSGKFRTSKPTGGSGLGFYQAAWCCFDINLTILILPANE
jgi:hypothetical protein